MSRILLNNSKMIWVLCAFFSTLFATYSSYAQTIQVEEMAIKSTGYESSGAWVLSNNGYVSDSLFFASTGYYKFVVRAKGYKASGGWPYVELHIDNVVSGPIVVDSYNYIEFTVFSYVFSGDHSIELHYINDSGSRSVTLDRIVISSTTMNDENWMLSLADAILVRFPSPASYSIRDWQFEELMWGVAKAYEISNDAKYLNYVKNHIDPHIDSQGNIDIEIDDTIPGILIVWLYQQTHEEKYRIASEKIGEFLLTEYERTSDGGFVHHPDLVGQLWDDTLGGLGRLLGALGAITGDNRYFDEGVLQFQVHAAHLQDGASGLFFHGYDETKSAAWSDPVTGQSPEFWARGNGWIIRGLADFLEYLPADHSGRQILIDIFRDLVDGLSAYQDFISGLWYTVLDKGNRPDDYLETSGSLLIAYGIYKGCNLGILDESYRQIADRSNRGLYRKIFERGATNTFVTGVSAGTGPGDYQNYVTKPIATGSDYPYGDGVFLQEKSEVTRGSAVPSYMISGNLRYFSNNNLISDVIVLLNGSLNESLHTGSEGAYAFENLGLNGNFQITATKAADSDVGENDITTYDAALVAQSSVGLISLSENEQIAADASYNGVIEMYDAALIARYSVGLPKLPDSHAGEWRFVPAMREYVGLNADYQNQDFIGVLIGNVHGGWQAPALRKQEDVSDRLNRAEMKVNKDESFEIPIEFLGDRNTIAVELSVDYDSTVLKFEGIRKTGLSDKSMLFYNAKSGGIRIGVYQTSAFEIANEFFRLKFRVLSTVKMQTDVFVSRYRINDSKVFQLNFPILIEKSNPTPIHYDLSQNYPNPFRLGGGKAQGTKITLALPEKTHVKLEVFNTLGQLVNVLLDEEKGSGFHTVVWDGKNENGEFATSGIYFYRMRSKSFQSNKKLLIIR